jgi:hypothetical protein
VPAFIAHPQMARSPVHHGSSKLNVLTVSAHGFNWLMAPTKTAIETSWETSVECLQQV